MGQHDTVWPLLKQSADPRLRTWIIHRVSPLGVTFEVLANRLHTETDDSIRRALILALGEYETDLPPVQSSLVKKLLDMYEHDPDPGIHSACQWLLRRWNRQSDVVEIIERLASGEDSEDCDWYVNRHGHTMIKCPGPIEFVMGSPGTEQRRRSYETMHRKLIDRSFALSSTEGTVKQFHDFLREVACVRHYYTRSYAPEDDCPQIAVT